MTALLAVGHGSQDPRAAVVVDDLMTLVRERRPELDVGISYLDHTEPGVLAALEDLAARGASGAVLVPLLLTAAFHTRVDVPAALAEASAALPGLALRQAAALGPHPLLLAAAERRLVEVGQRPGDPGTAVVLAASGTSDASALDVLRGVAATWAERGWWAVEPAYASASGPRVAETVALLRSRGAPRVVVSSYVLAPGFLPDRIVAGAADADALSPPLGACAELADLVALRFDEALREPVSP